jgi:hypothetical protein
MVNSMKRCNWVGLVLAAAVANGVLAQQQQRDDGTGAIDYSYAGYKAGVEAIPNVPVRVVVGPAAGDATGRIQHALDYVAKLPEAERGAVLLLPGRYEVAGGLVIGASNVVLRGSKDTVIVATGTQRRAVVTVKGEDRRQHGQPVAIDGDVPVGARRVRVKDASGLQIGQTVTVERPSTAEWIRSLQVPGDTGARWRPGSRDIRWDRTVTGIDGNGLTLDAPLTNALETAFGGGLVRPYTWPGRLTGCGVENLRIESTYDQANPKDENHAWYGVAIQNAKDCWVRQLDFAHLAGSAVWVYENCKQVTVRDCRSMAPISELANLRRQTFMTGGTQTLFLHCVAEEGLHDFTLDDSAPGPNAFVQCDAVNALDASGPVGSWATGVLYDNFRSDHSLVLSNLGRLHGFVGWNAANSMVYQSSVGLYRLASPPGATNWANGNWGTFDGNGAVQGTGDFANPTSLYTAQLAARLGKNGAKDQKAADALADWMDVPHDSYTNPPVDKAARAIAASVKPAQTVADWVETVRERQPIPVDAQGAKRFEELPPVPAAAVPAHPWKLELKGGQLVANGELLGGARGGVKYWQGSPDADANDDFKRMQTSLVRFVPGRYELLLTDPLPELMDAFLQKNVRLQEHHYALWYDRRNDDHERVKRVDGDALPPFYELPFVRSGQGTAWDGLSKYDLTKYNPYYFDRLHQYADLAEQKGVVLLHEHFFQHNILEAGAHWASSPWRTANNINATGFPEPPPYAGDKRIFMAEQFYDVTNAHRAELYRKYIRHVLDVHAGQSNVLHLTSGEYSGPLHFVQFWLDTVAQWEKETGKNALVGLAAPKDVQDAILADPERAKAVDVIVLRYWWYQADGTAYAPPGGQNLSPRQWLRLKNSSPTFDGALKAVAEYREKFPEKAVVFSPESGDAFGWAGVLGGGSLPELKEPMPAGLARSLVGMKVAESGKDGIKMANAAGDLLVWERPGGKMEVPAGMEIRGVPGRLVWQPKK